MHPKSPAVRSLSVIVFNEVCSRYLRSVTLYMFNNRCLNVCMLSLCAVCSYLTHDKPGRFRASDNLANNDDALPQNILRVWLRKSSSRAALHRTLFVG